MRFCEWKGSAIESFLRQRENKAASNHSTMCKSKVLTTINAYSNFQNKNPNPLVEERTSVPGLAADQGSRGAPVIFPSCWQSAWLLGYIEGSHFLCFRKSTICAISVSLRGHTPVQRFFCQVVVFTNGQSTTKSFFWFAHFVPFPTQRVPLYSSFGSFRQPVHGMAIAF